MSTYDVLIVGAGPAGMMAAYQAASSSPTRRRILLLEKNFEAGKKLLLAGSGQCNLTHAGKMDDFLSHYGSHGRFVKPALFHFTNTDLVQFFSQRRLPCWEREDGKIFPQTRNGRDVLRILLQSLQENHVEIQYQQTVQGIRPIGEKRFQVETEDTSLTTRKLILTTGGQSYPGTGSTGDGFPLAKTLSHTITPLAPALTPVYVRDFAFASCAGITLPQTLIALWRGGRPIAEHCGDLLFTHFGLSGPGILDFSRDFQKGDILRLFLDSEERFREILLENGIRELKKILSEKMGIPQRLAEALLSQANLAPQQRGCDVTRSQRQALCQKVLQPSFEIARLGNFREAMVTKGGVALSEVNRQTMESRLVPGLFFAGEILDVDGDTGGYNLQFAFSSGYLAGKERNGK